MSVQRAQQSSHLEVCIIEVIEVIEAKCAKLPAFQKDAVVEGQGI